MEMIPDQKPPVPRGEGPLAKAIFFGIIALLLGGVALYVMYPPLRKVGRIKIEAENDLAFYRGESFSENGKTKHIAMVQAPSGAGLDLLASLAKYHCEEALKSPILLGTRRRLAPMGEITVRFVQGGRYLYRFYDFDDWQMTYTNRTCALVPYLSGDNEGWVLRRAKGIEAEGAHGVRVSFRWEGRGDAPELPMKDVCEMVLSAPPRQLRDLINDDIEIVEIVRERGVDLGIMEFYTWIGFRYKRVNNLCLEIGTVEEA